MQSLGQRLQVKSQFIRKVITELYPLRVLMEERDAAIRRAEEAEAAARETVQAEVSRIQEENRKLREESSISGAVCGVTVFTRPPPFPVANFVDV